MDHNYILPIRLLSSLGTVFSSSNRQIVGVISSLVPGLSTTTSSRASSTFISTENASKKLFQAQHLVSLGIIASVFSVNRNLSAISFGVSIAR